jgi:preprotein translocase SecE subunit
MFKAITKFIHEARVELGKVTWPTRQAAINLTLIVVGVSIAFMLYVAVVDYGLTTGIKWLTAYSEQLQSKSSSPTSSGLPSGITATPVTETVPTN